MNSVAAALCFEYFDSASCQPPTVATDGPPAPCGSGATLNLPFTFEPAVAPIPYWYGQFRANAASPASKACSVWSSWYVVTPRGVILPISLRIASRTVFAFELLIVALPLSMKWPPPADAIHSSALQVRPSYELPWKTNP